MKGNDDDDTIKTKELATLIRAKSFLLISSIYH